MPRLLTPQSVTDERRSRLSKLEPADDPPAVVRMHGRCGSRIDVRELCMRCLRAIFVVDA